MRSRLLIISPDLRFRAELARLVNRGGYRAEVAESLGQALRLNLHEIALALVALERLGPEEAEGIDELRARLGTVLTVAPAGSPNVSGYDLINPDDDAGLLARIAKALAPASEPEAVEMALEFAGYCLDLGGHSLVGPEGKEVLLTHSEFGLLCALAQRPGRVLSRDQLMQLIAGRDAEAYDRSVDMQIMRLRRKIERDPKHPSLIVTVPGTGYKFAAAVRQIKSTMAQDQNPAATPSGGRSGTPERRNIVALAAELVPSEGAKLPDDPEDLRKIIVQFRDYAAAALTRHGASIGESHGREIVAYFSFPFEQEDAAERALHAALALVRASAEAEAVPLSGFAIRVGVSSGLVIAEPGGEIVGETPAEARRLCEAAERGQVIVADDTRRQAGQLFAYNYLGPIFPNGRAGALSAYELTGPSAHSSRSESVFVSQLTPLVDREEELTLLTSAWRTAKSGEGRLVLVSGEPGIGKSRLLVALEGALANEAHVCLRYFCSALHQETALHPIIARMEREAGFVRGESNEVRLDKLEALFGPANLPPEDVALIAALLSVPTGGRYPVLELTPQQRKQRTFAALYGRVVQFACEAPVLMLAEDVHWADPSSLELLDAVMDRLQQLPVLLVLSYRSEFAPPWTGRAGVSMIALGRLSRRHSATLSVQVCGERQLSRRLQAQIIEQADGVPLFIEELTESVLEGSSLTAIPSTLRATLLARLDRLPLARHVAQIGAVVGREFSQALIAPATSLLDVQIAQGLDELCACGLVTRRGAALDTVYVFKHTLVQDAAYSALLREHRRELHAKIAEALENLFPTIADNEPEILARHCAEAGLTEKAAHLWGVAGRRSLARSAPVEAVAQLTRALALIEVLPSTLQLRGEEISLQTALMTTLYLVKGYAAPEAKAALERARTLLARAESLGDPNGNPLVLFAILSGLWTVNYIAFNGEAQMEFANQYLELAEKQNNVNVIVAGNLNMGVTLSAIGSLEKASSYFDRAFALFPNADSASLIALTGFDYRHPGRASCAIRLWLLGFPQTALSECENAISRARETGHVATLLMTLTTAVIVHILSGHYDSARAIADEIEAASNEKELAFFLWPAKMAQGALAVLSGSASEAIQIIVSADSIARQTGTTLWGPRKKTLLAVAHARVGQFDLARKCLQEALEEAGKTKESWFEAEIHRVGGEIAQVLPECDVVEAQRCFECAMNVAQSQRAQSLELRAATSLARLWRRQEKQVEARNLLSPIYSKFTEGHETRDLREAKALLIELA